MYHYYLLFQPSFYLSLSIFFEFFFSVEGKELPGAPGYKYYGAAKDLPGVRELFQEKDDESELRRRKR